MFSYADDTAEVFSGGTWAEVRRTAETGLSRIAKWLNQSLLTLNAFKSNYICFTKYNHTQPLNGFKIKIRNCSNPSNPHCQCVKMIGCSTRNFWELWQTSDCPGTCTLNWSWKKSENIWTFITLRHVTSKKLLRQVYISLAQSILTYCLPWWGGTTKTKFLELERAQRSLL